MNISHIIILSTVLFLGIGCNEGNTEEMENGLIIEDLVVGEGAEAQDYNKVVVNYTGSLEDGSVFDSSLNPGREPFTFFPLYTSDAADAQLCVDLGVCRIITYKHTHAYNTFTLQLPHTHLELLKNK